MTELQHTLLNSWHLSHGAHMASFGGYHMPLWYKTGPIQEHRSVLRSAGLFDTSHMSMLLIEGPGALQLLQTALTKDLQHCVGKGSPLEPGRATYGFLLDDKGHVVDDAIVMMEARETYLLVVNAGMGAPVAQHLLSLGSDLDVAVSDLSGKLCKMDLQGPAALRILRRVLKPSRKLSTPIPYFGFVGHYDHLQEGVQSTLGYGVMVSRTGYTGEFGFELIVRPDAFVPLWEQLLSVGTEAGLIPCGLGARDSLRAGAVLPLSHQDIGPWPCRNHPWTFALPMQNGRFSKPFHGDQALLDATDAPCTYAFRADAGRKVEAHADVLLNGEVIGEVLTCATDMGIDLVDGQVLSLASPGAPADFNPKGLACGFIKVQRPLPLGQTLLLRDKRREMPVTLVQDIRPDRSARMPWPG